MNPKQPSNGRATALALLVAWLVVSATGCRAQPPRLVKVSEARGAMGTYVAITVFAPSEAHGRKVIEAAFARIARVEQAASTYRPNSEVSRLVAAAGGQPVAISPCLAALLRRGMEVAEETDGAFDMTCGPLVMLWRKTWKRGKMPSAAQVEAAKALVDRRALKLSPDGKKAQLLKPGMSLALGGIAKGYAVDQAVEAIRQAGIPSALVDAGGDIYALGSPPYRNRWLVGVRDPGHPDDILPKALAVANQAVATSGDYLQGVKVGGRVYSHILDPRTGQPVEKMASVTVVAPDATTADAYATAASVLGPKKAIEFGESHPGVEIMVIHREGERLVELRTSGFARLEVVPEKED